MTIRILQEPSSMLAEYARVPIAFEARAVLRVAEAMRDSEEFVLSEQPLRMPYLKDYDAVPSERPTSWPHRFDLSAWTFFAAYANHERIGGATVIMNAPELELLEERRDLALLWDIRVAPSVRRSGVGALLLHAAEKWAREQGARSMKVETQDINVPACRFYARNGYRLRAVNPNAYPRLPHETQLLWYKDLENRGND